MSEFYFYGTHNDSLSLIERMLQGRDFWITPSINHSSKTPATHRCLSDDLRSALAINPRVFICGNFTSAPLQFSEITTGKFAGTFVVNQTVGGPYIIFTAGMFKKMDSNLWHLGPGVLCLPNAFGIGPNGREGPNVLAKQVFSELRDLIKCSYKKTKVGIHTVLVSEEALALLDSESAVILNDGLWLDRKGRVVKSNI